jgi:hypothetical protein
MKTLFVCAECNIEDHVGEEYDEIIEVENQPTTATIQEWANRIKGRIRKLAHQLQKEGEEQVVVVTLDGPSPYNAMLINLQVRMKPEEDITVELPYLASTTPTTDDPEARELLDKLDQR